MRWIAVLLLVAVLLAAAACEEQGAVTDEGATPTTARDARATTPVATVGFYQLPTAEPIEEAEAQRLRSLAPTADEVGVAFPDLAPFQQELRGDLGQEYEHVDLAKLGFVAGYTAFYRPSDERRTAYISFASFNDASGASGSFDEMSLEQTQPQPRHVSTFEVSEGDAAHGYTIPASQGEPALTVVLLRRGRVVAFIVILHPNGEDRREGMRQLARDVASNIKDALAQ